jgi:hypothetical protein
MHDCCCEDFPRLIETAAGIEHVFDLGAVFRPLLDFVKVTVVRNQRLVRLFVGPFASHGMVGFFGGALRDTPPAVGNQLNEPQAIFGLQIPAA